MRIALILALTATAAQAGPFTPPDGCTAHLTVQGHSCIVAHHWTCEGDAPGVQWSGELGQDGLFYVGQIDNEAQWLHSYYPASDEIEQLIQPAVDPANLTALLATGIDTYDFKLNTTNGVHRVVGFDRIAERDVMIDGEPMHRTEYTVRTTDEDGEVVFAAEGSEYVSEKHRRFFSGSGTITGPDAPVIYDDTPVKFIYPGEKGFLSKNPIYDCAATTARFDTQTKDPAQ